MKKFSLLAVSFLMGHSLTSTDQYIVKKSIDNDDHYFQSLCPSFRYGDDDQKTTIGCRKSDQPIVKIDRGHNTDLSDSLLTIRQDCAGSISKFREFTKNYFPEVL